MENENLKPRIKSQKKQKTARIIVGAIPTLGGVSRPIAVPGELRSLPTHCEDKKQNVLNARTAHKPQK